MTHEEMIRKKKHGFFSISRSIFVFALVAAYVVYKNLSFLRESHRPIKAVRGGSCAHSKAEPLVLHIDAYGWKRAREAYGCKFTRDRQCLSQASAVILNLAVPATSTSVSLILRPRRACHKVLAKLKTACRRSGFIFWVE